MCACKRGEHRRNNRHASNAKGKRKEEREREIGVRTKEHASREEICSAY
jgi:hypothetical protein